MRQRRDHRLHQVAAAELHRRQVDRDLDVVAASSPPRVQASRSTHSPSGTISPISSAIGMNSAGGTMPRFGMAPAQQRLEAADPVGRRCRPAAGSAARTRRWRSAWRRSSSMCAARLQPARSISGSKKRWTPPPSDLARYSAMSALRSSSSRSSPSPGDSAMPMLAPTTTSMAVDLVAALSTSISRRRKSLASFGERRADCTIANSSPPSRATSCRRATSDAAARPPAFSRRSPIGWPKVSLTFLNRSRSTQSTADALVAGWLALQRLRKPVLEKSRFGRLVRPS